MRCNFEYATFKLTLEHDGNDVNIQPLGLTWCNLFLSLYPCYNFMTYWLIGCICSIILYFCGLRIIYGAISQIKFMGPTWAHLSHVAPDGPHVGPINLAIRDTTATVKCIHSFYPNFHLKLFSRHSFLPHYNEKYNIIIQLLISMITGGALIDSYIWSHYRIWISTDDVFILNMITQDSFIHIPISRW